MIGNFDSDNNYHFQQERIKKNISSNLNSKLDRHTETLLQQTKVAVCNVNKQFSHS